MGSLLGVDDLVADVVDALHRTGELDNTYLFFVSDNGVNLWAHGLINEEAPYEESLHVPAVVAGPGVAPGTDSHIIDLSDLAPTFLELAGLPVDDSADGRSLVPLLHGESPPWHHDIPVQYAGRGVQHDLWNDLWPPLYHLWKVLFLGMDVPAYRGVRTETHLYVEWYDEELFGRHEEELYDMTTDPWQLDNLLTSPEGQEANADLLEELRERTDELRTSPTVAHVVSRVPRAHGRTHHLPGRCPPELKPMWAVSPTSDVGQAAHLALSAHVGANQRRQASAILPTCFPCRSPLESAVPLTDTEDSQVRLARFEHDARTALGLVSGDEVADLSSVDGVPGDIASFLEAGGEAFEAAHRAQRTAARLPLTDVRLLAPVPVPGKFLAIGLNYADHVAETGAKAPDFPVFFNKQRTCVTGPSDPIHIPRASIEVDYEGELGVVIGRRCRHVPADRAHEVVAGYIVVDDVSVRDWQRWAPTMTLGKSFDTHGPTGPWITTPDEIGDPQDLRIRTWLNDDLRQDGNTRDMIVDIAHQVETLSTVFTLEPGDLISTGTPAGVGFTASPQVFLRPGDVVRIEIDGLGTIENPVIKEPGDTATLG